MRRFWTLLLLVAAVLPVVGQQRKVQNKPYIDLRPLHFGISIGLNMQDVEFTNVGPQTIQLPEGGTMPAYVLCDADNWNPGFSVGVLADLRLSQHFALRLAPTMHFGTKHLVFRNMLEHTESGKVVEVTQNLKNTYLSLPLSVKFAAERFNNHRPYLIAGVNPMVNLSGNDQDYLQLKRYDVMLEIGLGCDFYLPFFKLIPELKFCYGLVNSLDAAHVNSLTDASKHAYALSVSGAHSKMVVLTLYFE
jgi:hypothetical protein